MTGTANRSRSTSTRRQPLRTGHVRLGSAGRHFRGQGWVGWKGRLILTSGFIVLCLVVWATVARRIAPTTNTSLTRFDAIIVLGSPVDGDGNPTPSQLSRVTEAVQEYERGVAPRLILTGGATNHDFVEAKVMARAAEAQGIPASAIEMDGQAMDTIHNACYSVRIMKDHGWHSAEVVSSGFHLPRTAMIFGKLPVEWRVHAAPPLEPLSAFRTGMNETRETLSTVRYLVWAREMEQCEP